MRTIRLLIMGLLCLLIFTKTVKAQDMQKKISLKVDKISLAEVLNQIQEKYNIRFSYLNNELSADTIYNFHVQEKPLAEVLDRLLEKSEVGYKQHNGQIIIKNGFPKSNPVEKPPMEKEAGGSANAKQAGKQEPKKELLKIEEAAEEEMPLSEEAPFPISGPDRKEELPLPDETASFKIPKSLAVDDSLLQGEEERVKEENKVNGDSSLATSKPKEAKSQGEELSVPVAPYHVGFIYPISTHGRRAPEYINKISVHLLVGTASGLDGVEFSGIGNIENDFVSGFQAAGVFNFVRNEVDGVQTAGVVNLNGGKLEGAQIGGILNMSLGSVKGAQVAGLMNITDTLDGAQFAGFLNKASHVEGIQAAGFMNKARIVKGVQIGIINIADSVAGGVPIGLLSIVKNGYRAVEVYAGEDFEANINFKIGVKRFYNIFAIGAELNGGERSGFGYGIGSEWVSGRRFSMGTDVISYYVNEKSYTQFPDGLFDGQALNILNKVRITASYKLGSRLAFFGGPTYNVFVSRYQESAENPLGSGLVTNTFFDHTNRITNVKMWIGFNAGIRF